MPRSPVRRKGTEGGGGGGGGDIYGYIAIQQTYKSLFTFLGDNYNENNSTTLQYTE